MSKAKVLKKNGTVEEFIPEKIIVSCIKAGAPVGIAREIAAIVEAKAKAETSTAEIRSFVLWLLNEKNPEWEKNWLRYEEEMRGQ
jgi:transcriptional repressor NrdR